LSVDTDHRDAGVAHLKKTKVSYPEYEKNLKAGKYPNNGAATEWFQAFAAATAVPVRVHAAARDQRGRDERPLGP
jgi:hypothetical protein